MTVPTDFRRNSEIPGILVLHYADMMVAGVTASPPTSSFIGPAALTTLPAPEINSYMRGFPNKSLDSTLPELAI
jgi:hypothetical protein